MVGTATECSFVQTVQRALHMRTSMYSIFGNCLCSRSARPAWTDEEKTQRDVAGPSMVSGAAVSSSAGRSSDPFHSSLHQMVENIHELVCAAPAVGPREDCPAMG